MRAGGTRLGPPPRARRRARGDRLQARARIAPEGELRSIVVRELPCIHIEANQTTRDGEPRRVGVAFGKLRADRKHQVRGCDQVLSLAVWERRAQVCRVTLREHTFTSGGGGDETLDRLRPPAQRIPCTPRPPP